MVNLRIATCEGCRRTVSLPPASDLCDVCRREAEEDPEQRPGPLGCVLTTIVVVLLFAAAWFLIPEQWSW